MATVARRFPANDITWSNYKWAVEKAGRWTLIWGWCVDLHRHCAALRRDVSEGRAAMAELDPDSEGIVGVPRHPRLHRGRAVAETEQVHILHSADCRDSGLDLRTCPYSIALDRGIRRRDWIEDAPVELAIVDGRLVMAAVIS